MSGGKLNPSPIQTTTYLFLLENTLTGPTEGERSNFICQASDLTEAFGKLNTTINKGGKRVITGVLKEYIQKQEAEIIRLKTKIKQAVNLFLE